MDSKFIQYKLNDYYFKDDPYIELRSCFTPCIKDLNSEETTEKENKCFNNCLNKFINLTHHLKVESPFYMKQRNDIQNQRNYLEVQMNKTTTK